ncbi:MAG: galactose mutarotase [Gemmatimonadaceae bacterium]|nr:galactose mutarotase [Gemmatimonadaceae bacterium]
MSAAESRVERAVAVHDETAVDRYVLRNTNGMELACLSFGGIFERLLVPNAQGELADVVLGFDRVEDYLTDRCYFGALIGRFANRIDHARFVLDGSMYLLEPNEGAHHLHGGVMGFHAHHWTCAMAETSEGQAVVLRLVSPHGDAGYPGTVQVQVTYTLTNDNALIVDYHADTDKATPFSMTQHAYFNLSGGACDILGHELTLAASSFLPVNTDLIPTGEVRRVSGTPFDFRTPQVIGSRIDTADEQLAHGDGYDHNFVLDRLPGTPASLVATLVDQYNGRQLDVLTTAPGLQLCTGNNLHRGVRGKGGKEYTRCRGVALETQHFPNSPNRPDFPSSILRPGEPLHSRTMFQFTALRTPSQRP